MTAYYNEIDPYAAAWLRNLIAAGLIAPGDVDERSITDVRADDVAGYAQCHFFAGIAGWSIAARLAGWPDDRELWTGSAPCQPYSVAGEGKGFADDRDLWPHYFRLIRDRRPDVAMGEQVAAAVGKHWLDRVFADMEGIGYACGAVVVPACSVDAPHGRDRLWFVADTPSGRQQVAVLESRRCDASSECGQQTNLHRGDGACGQFVAHAGSERRQQVGRSAHGDEAQNEGRTSKLHHVTSSDGEGAVADSERARPFPSTHAGVHREQESYGSRHVESFGYRSPWHDHEWIIGHDGKARRVEPSIRLLAHGVSARVGKLRALGNAIVPQVAAQVIAAYMETRP